jgi:hypothetical protein
VVIGEDGINFNLYKIQPRRAMTLAAVPIVLMLAALVAT